MPYQPVASKQRKLSAFHTAAPSLGHALGFSSRPEVAYFRNGTAAKLRAQLGLDML